MPRGRVCAQAPSGCLPGRVGQGLTCFSCYKLERGWVVLPWFPYIVTGWAVGSRKCVPGLTLVEKESYFSSTWLQLLLFSSSTTWAWRKEGHSVRTKPHPTRALTSAWSGPRCSHSLTHASTCVYVQGWFIYVLSWIQGLCPTTSLNVSKVDT